MMSSSDLSDCVLIGLIRVVFLSILLGHVRVAGIEFVEQPENVTKILTYGRDGTGESFVVECQVSALESDQKLSWFKNGDIISDGYEFRDNVKGLLVDITNDRYRLNSYSTSSKFTLQVRLVSPNTAEFDSGSYQCAVTRSWNDVAVPDGRSRTAFVNIYVIPSSNYPVCKICLPGGHYVTTTPTKSANINVLSSAIYPLTCLSGQSTPVVGLFWYRNDQNESLPRSSNGEDKNALSYNITYDWTPSNNDGSTLTFTCTLQHPGLLSDRTCSLNLNIQYAPIVTIDTTDAKVTEENDEILLHCNQDANRQITETVWYYDDDVVNSGGRFRLEGMSLRISTFSSRDNGVHTVTCELTNVIGTGSDSVTLTVNIPTPSAKVTLPPSPKVTLPRSPSSGITVPDYHGMTTVAANKSNNTDPFAIPRKTDNTGIIIGSVVGVCLLSVLIVTSVILIGLKARRKSSQSQKSSGDNFDTRRGESGGDVIGAVTEDTTSERYESTNGAFGNECSDIALEVGATLQTDGKNKTAESGKDHRSDTVNSAELYSKPKKKQKPLKKKINQRKTGDEQYANIGLKAKAKSGDPSVDPDVSPYANMSEKQNRAIDSRQVHKQGGGDAEVSQEKPAFTKNAEGLTYAELDLSNTSVTSRPMKMSEAENTVYADLQI